MIKYNLNEDKMVAWGVAQGNRMYEAFSTREQARKAHKEYEQANDGDKFYIVKLTFDSVVR